jgi:hypothetical protein
MQIFNKKLKTFQNWTCKTNLEIVPAALATPLLTVASVQLFREGQNRRHTKG